MDPTLGQDLSAAKEAEVLRKRLVAAERQRKEVMAQMSAENRMLQMQLQVGVANIV